MDLATMNIWPQCLGAWISHKAEIYLADKNCYLHLGHLNAFVQSALQQVIYSYADGGGSHARCQLAHWK